MQNRSIQTLSLSLALALTLGLSGCGTPGNSVSSGATSLPPSGSAPSDSTGTSQSEVSSEPAPDSAKDSAFPAEAWLEFQLEGETETVRAELYEGEGYILYLPEGGWEQASADGTDCFSPEANADVELRVGRSEQTFDEAAEALLAEGWLQSDDDDAVFGRTEEGRAEVLRLAESGEQTWYLGWSYPDQSEYYEGWGSRLPAIAGTFQTTE